MSAGRRLIRFAAAGMLAAVLVVFAAGSASAHNVLISSNPSPGAALTAPPSTITFTFDQPVQNFNPVVSLVGPNGHQYATGTPTINGDVVTGSVSAGPAGAYVAAYRVVSADGHPVTGEVHFTVTGSAGASGPTPVPGASASAAPTPVPGASASASASAAPPAAGLAAAPAGGRGGLSAWLWLVLAIAVLVVAAAAVLLLRRPGGVRAPTTDRRNTSSRE